jgi:UDP-2-acetamido-2-deoxy-ribo-hexuluronate aminotransferase
MSIPFIDLNRTEPDFHSAWMSVVERLSLSKSFIGGAEVSQLEAELRTYAGVAHAVSCANGTDALQLALRAVGVGAGDVVIVPEVTFWATYEAVVNVGAQPVTVDVCQQDHGYDWALLEKAVMECKPKAILAVHLYGWGPERLADLRQFCLRRDIHLVEDGAQSFGVIFEEHPIAKGALITTTSFYPAKVLGAAGDAGAVFTQNEALANKVRELSNHGRHSHYGYASVGWNSRMDSLQAAYLRLSLTHLDARIQSRLESEAYYQEHINSPYISVHSAPKAYRANGYCNVLELRDHATREALQIQLKSMGIGFANIYPSPMSTQQGALNSIKASYINGRAEAWCKQVLNLPLFPYMTLDELNLITQTVNNFQL